MSTQTARPSPSSVPGSLCPGWRASLWPLIVAVVTATAIIGASLLLKAVSAPWARVAVAVAPVIPFALMFIVFTRLARRLDELWVRIQFEALALAFMSVAVITVAYGQLQRVGVVAEGNYGFLWPVMALVYAVCLAIAYRRYQ